jgi:adenosylhomocysteine nucleosidase
LRRPAPTGLVAILVLTAVELEARALARALSLPLLPSLSFPAFGRDSIRLACVGLRAGLLVSRWTSLVGASDHPLVVSAGICGGLDPELRVGDLVLPDGVVSDAGARLPVTGTAAQRAAAAGDAPARTGVMLTSSRIVGTPEAKAALRAATGAVAVDMESAAILEAAAARGCASLVVRAISDDASESLPEELMRLMGADGRIRGGGVLALARPRVLGRALRLRRSTRRALASVANSLARLAA